MRQRIQNIKWRLPAYFLGAVVLTGGIGIAGWSYYLGGSLTISGLFALVAASLLIGPVIGYLSGVRYQRRMDAVHLAIKRLALGDLTVRIPLDTGGNDEFHAIYTDFNEVAEAVEHRIRLLQRLGEENAMLRKESNEAAVLGERKRLANDLHDTVSQQLFAIHMSASSLPKLMEQRPEMVDEVIAQLIRMSEHAQRQLRGLIAQLKPLELEGKSLQAALDQWFPAYCRHNGLQGKLESDTRVTWPEALEHQLFLIIQEAMSNVVKHAEAHNVSLALHETDRQYRLTVIDDGKGMPARQETKASYGLNTMKERTQVFGGSFEILGRPGSGTELRVKIPKFAEKASNSGDHGEINGDGDND